MKNTHRRDLTTTLTEVKTEGLKVLVEREKSKRAPVRTVCIHGEENCARCGIAEYETQLAEDLQWECLEEDDLRKIVVSLPDIIRDILRKNPETVVLAGGYIRAGVGNEKAKDIDLFVNSEVEANKICKTAKLNSHKLDLCLTGVVEDQEYQVVWRYPYKTASDILDAFDYTVTKAAIWFSNGDDKNPAGWRSVCHDRFYRDLARKMLVYKTSREYEHITGFIRLIKYASYGYTIDPESLAKVIISLCLSLDINSGFEGMLKQLKEAFKVIGSQSDWDEMSKKFIKPKKKKRARHSSSGGYSYGS